MYTIYSKPMNKIGGARTVEVQAETAVEALRIAEGLWRSDENVTIKSPSEGMIDLHFLRILAKEEQESE